MASVRVDPIRLVLLVSVSLATAQEVCVDGDLRLAEPVERSVTTGLEHTVTVVGPVQYCLNGNLSTVCVSSSGRWGENEVEVACRQLGYQGYSERIKCLDNSRHLVTLTCPGSEVSDLQQCEVMEVEDCDCDLSQTAHLVAECRKDCTDETQRLEGGSTDREGRVEVCVDGCWGTVQTSQPRRVAEAVCNESTVILSTCLGTQFGYRQSKPVYHCDVNASGLLTCSEGEKDHHILDLGVVCGPQPEPSNFSCNTSNGQFRLTNGSTNRAGRVEVCVDGRWGTVCNNSQEGVARAVCSQLGGPLGGTIKSTELHEVSKLARRTYYCYSNSTCVEACCDHSTSLTVKCEELNNTNMTSMEGPNDIIIPVVAAALAISTVLLVAVVICAFVLTIVRRKRLEQSPPGTSTQKNETYSLKQLNDQVYDEATSTAPNYSSLGPGYDVVVSKRDIFDVTDHDQSEASKPQAPDSPTPVREETSKKEDDFYDVEEHTCSVVNKKKAKTTSEDGEGEREEPLDYEMAVPGETSWGGMDEGYF